MTHILKAMAIAGALGAGSLLFAPPASAHTRGSSVSIYVDVGNVAIAYRDGYYDHHHRWHSWRSRDEWRHFRRHHHHHYRDYYHHRDRGRHRGWRDRRH